MSTDVVGRAEMADEDCGSGRWEQNSPTKNDRVNGKCSKFCLSLLFLHYLLHQNQTVAVGAHRLAPLTDRDLLTLLLTAYNIASALLWGRGLRCYLNVRGINLMVDETAGDGGRNGTEAEMVEM